MPWLVECIVDVRVFGRQVDEKMGISGTCVGRNAPFTVYYHKSHGREIDVPGRENSRRWALRTLGATCLSHSTSKSANDIVGIHTNRAAE
jgi:hypothetical protein